MDLQLTPTRFLTSPIVEIAVGEGDGQTIMTAHQALICESPFLEEFVNKFESSGPVSAHANCMGWLHLRNSSRISSQPLI